LLVVAALLAGYYALALSATLDKCVCFDEIAHLTAGYSYWLFNDYRLQPENGILPQRWGALPLLLTRPTFPEREQPYWHRSHVWKIGAQFFYQSGNDADRMLLMGRAMMGVLGVLLGLFVYGYSRWLFGPAAGGLSLTLFVICPNLLAHGPLINSDTAACLFFLASLATTWWVLHEITWPSLIVSGLVLGGLFVAKFSAVVILPVMVLLAVLRVLDGRPLTVRLWTVGRASQPVHPEHKPVSNGVERTGWEARSTPAIFVLRRHQMELIFGVFLLQGAMVVGIIWAFYGFRYTAFNDHQPELDSFHSGGWEAMLDGLGLPPDVNELLQLSRDYEVLPEAHLYGFAHSLRNSQMRDCFLNGEVRSTGWRHFFPYAFLVKTPLGTLIVLVLALLAWWGPVWNRSGSLHGPVPNRSPRGGFYATAPLWIFLAVYWMIAINSRLNIGHRHILPTYPPMFVLAGAAIVWLRGLLPWREMLRSGRGVTRWTMAMLLLASLGWAAVDSLLTWPNYLAYFNQIVGGPRQGYRHLVDSSLDWGQDLPGLRKWLDQHNPAGREPAHLAYFGSGSPEYYGIQATPLLRMRGAAPDTTADVFTPGIYAISATYLQGIYLFPRLPWSDLHEKDYQAALTAKRYEEASPASFVGLPASCVEPWPFGVIMAELGRDASSTGNRRKLANLQNYHFARLCIYLKEREPEDQVNYSILIYRVSADDLRKAFAPRP